MFDAMETSLEGEVQDTMIPEPHDAELWKKIMAFDLSLVTDTFARRNPEFASMASTLEHECKRFLYLATVIPNLEHAPTKPIDEYWHMFILFTAEYTRFCEMICGGYIHHKPLGADDHQAVFDRTQAMITELFGNFSNRELWMLPAPATSCCSARDVSPRLAA